MNENFLQSIPTLEEPMAPTDFMVQNFWVPLAWGLGVALLLVGVALVIVQLRRRRSPQQPPTPQEIAFRALDIMAQELPALREGSLRLSMVLRTFLTGQTQDPALFETHEEFSRRMDALSSVPTSCQYATRHLLERLAELKYAGSSEQDPQKIRVLIEEAREVINNITRAQAQEAEMAAAVAKVQKIS